MFKMWTMMEGLFFLFLLVGSIEDIVRKKISIWYLAIGMLLAVVMQISGTEKFDRIHIWGMVTGVLFLLISKATEEGIGYGDSILIFILGICLGIWKLLVVLAIAFASAAIIAGIGMVFHKCKRKTRIPFLPFLTIGYLGVIGW